MGRRRGLTIRSHLFVCWSYLFSRLAPKKQNSINFFLPLLPPPTTVILEASHGVDKIVGQ